MVCFGAALPQKIIQPPCKEPKDPCPDSAIPHITFQACTLTEKQVSRVKLT